MLATLVVVCVGGAGGFILLQWGLQSERWVDAVREWERGREEREADVKNLKIYLRRLMMKIENDIYKIV